MNARFKAAAAAILAACVIGSYAYASEGTPPAKKHPVNKTAKPKGPTVEEQIQSLRQDLEGQINGLKSDLAAKDTQLKQAQQAAADAQAAAAKAQAAADSGQQAVTENQSAVNALQATVTDMKSSNASVVSSFSDETSKIKKAIDSPDVIHFKGITLSPTGSFIAAETVYRSRGMGADINTQFTGVPLDAADNAKISEWQGTGRQSRVALKAIGKLDNMTMTGYYEADWLGSGTASNNNQSNSYVMRQRQIWAQAALTNGWTFTGGQMWSLATETTQGLSNGTEILPATIDPQYNVGFVWARQYGFRVAKAFSKKFFLGGSLENAEALTPSGSSWRDRIYPNAPTNALNAYNWDTGSMGVGASVRGALAQKKVSVGIKTLYGEGVGRYGSSTIADITLNPKGGIAPLRAFSSLATLELNPDPRVTVYFNAGVDYVYRRYYGKEGYGSPLTSMSGCNTVVLPGNSTTPSGPGSCGNQNKDLQEGTIGYWYYIYNGPKGRLRQGIQYSHFRRDLWSGVGGATNPGNGAMGTDDEIFTSFRYYLP